MSYAIVDAEVRYLGAIVDRAEVSSFTPLAFGWAKDASSVFANGRHVRGAHAASFVPLDALFGIDRESIYAGSTCIEGNARTIRVLGRGYAIDDRHAHFAELRLGWLVACWTIETADPKSLTVLAHGWATDATHAYCGGHVVADADPRRLVPLTPTLATDGARVFASTRVIEHADAATFRALDDAHYGVDARGVFHGKYWGRVVAPATPTTFRALGNDFAVDDHYAYWRDEVLAGVPPETFRPLSPSFASSGDLVFYFYSGIHGTRQVTANLWGTKPIILDGADPTTFRSLGEFYGADATGAWYHSSAMQLRGDARRLELLNPHVARDDAAIYFEEAPIDGADPETFRFVWSTNVARDRDRWYAFHEHDHGSHYELIDAQRARELLDADEASDA